MSTFQNRDDPSQEREVCITERTNFVASDQEFADVIKRLSNGFEMSSEDLYKELDMFFEPDETFKNEMERLQEKHEELQNTIANIAAQVAQRDHDLRQMMAQNPNLNEKVNEFTESQEALMQHIIQKAEKDPNLQQRVEDWAKMNPQLTREITENLIQESKKGWSLRKKILFGLSGIVVGVGLGVLAWAFGPVLVFCISTGTIVGILNSGVFTFDPPRISLARAFSAQSMYQKWR